MPVHYRNCHLCEAMCGIVVEHEGGRVTSIRGDRDDPFSRGHVCPKAAAIADLHHDPDRLRRPQLKSGDGWRTVGWDEALDLAADRLAGVQAEHGRNALGLYLGNPTVHDLGATLFSQVLARQLRTFNRFSPTSADQLPHMLTALELFGHQLLLPVPDLDRCDHLLIFGGNPLVSNGSIMTAPDIKRRLKAIAERGQLIVLDPRRTRTAELATEHVFIRPGTDALLLAAMLHHIFETGQVRLGHLTAVVDGVDELRDALGGLSPEAVAAATGIEPAVTRRLADGLAQAERGCAYGRIGLCTQRFGGLGAFLLIALDLVTGHLDRSGGMMFTQPAADLVALTAKTGDRGHFDKGRSRVRGLPEFGGEYPVSTLVDEIETPGEGQIRALVTFAGNPVLSVPSGDRLGRALEGLDFMVSIDPYCNETTRYADLILPGVSPLEKPQYDLVFNALAVRNVAKLSPALFEPPPGTMADWEILLELSTRIARRRGLTEGLAARAAAAGLRKLGPVGILDGMLRAGPRLLGAKGSGLSAAALREHPHGVDLGPLEPCLPGRLFTPEQRIDLGKPRFLDDVPRLREELGREAPQLLLIGRRQLRTNNSWLHNSRRLVKGPRRCTLLMHPDDAASRKLETGSEVRLRSAAGEVVAPLEVSDEVMAGVVSLPHGFGHDRPGVSLQVAKTHAGVSVNDVTDAAQVDPLSGNAVLNGVPVEVMPA